jgi:hypothetical protein
VKEPAAAGNLAWAVVREIRADSDAAFGGWASRLWVAGMEMETL